MKIKTPSLVFIFGSTLLVLACASMVLLAQKADAAATAPGVCTYTSAAQFNPVETAVAAVSANGDQDCEIETGGTWTESSSPVVTVSQSNSASLMLDNQVIRTYSSTVNLPNPVPCDANGWTTAYKAAAPALYAKALSEMVDDCAKLQAGGTCTCLGADQE